MSSKSSCSFLVNINIKIYIGIALYIIFFWFMQWLRCNIINRVKDSRHHKDSYPITTISVHYLSILVEVQVFLKRKLIMPLKYWSLSQFGPLKDVFLSPEMFFFFPFCFLKVLVLCFCAFFPVTKMSLFLHVKYCQQIIHVEIDSII